jgi:DNA-binding MarR family transcriptional regulator
VTDDSEAQGELWLTREQQLDWVSLIALVMTLPVSLDAQLKKDEGINLFEYHILVQLAAAPERMRMMSDLANQTRGSLSRLSHAVSRLETAGWVRRRSCEGAGRRTEAHLTAAGWEKLQQAAPAHVREARHLVVDALTAEQFKNLGEAARLIVARTDPAAAETLTRTVP